MEMILKICLFHLHFYFQGILSLMVMLCNRACCKTVCTKLILFLQHGIDSEKPLCYSHIDIAGSSGPFPGVPTGSPVLALAAKYILHRV